MKIAHQHAENSLYRAKIVRWMKRVIGQGHTTDCHLFNTLTARMPQHIFPPLPCVLRFFITECLIPLSSSNPPVSSTHLSIPTAACKYFYSCPVALYRLHRYRLWSWIHSRSRWLFLIHEFQFFNRSSLNKVIFRYKNIANINRILYSVDIFLIMNIFIIGLFLMQALFGGCLLPAPLFLMCFMRPLFRQ